MFSYLRVIFFFSFFFFLVPSHLECLLPFIHLASTYQSSIIGFISPLTSLL